MIESILINHIPASLNPKHAHRCQHCVTGHVVAGDGFSMGRCIECGRYQEGLPPHSGEASTFVRFVLGFVESLQNLTDKHRFFL